MSKKILLSICIPSYNRFGSINKTLESILKCHSREIEVVILDNCSSTPIEEQINIREGETRVHIYKQNHQVPGPNNIMDALLYGQGEYRMICLDKDMIQGEYLDNFLTCLKTHAEISGGFCKLDSKNVNMDNEFFPKSEMYEHAYRGMHPSGMFFRKDAVSIERDKTKCFEENSVYYANPFIHDLLLARSYSLGIGMYYKNRLVTVETQEDTKKIQSFSFTKENQNLFFMPGNRINQMNVNFMHLNTLNLPYEVFDKVVSAICFRTVKQVAYEYRFLLSDETVCRHYRLEMRYINKPELEENAKRVCDEILKTPYLKYSMEKRKELAEQSYFYGFELV